MSIYKENGTEQTTAYNVVGNTVRYAYDVGGNIVFDALTTPFKIMTYNVGQWYIGSGTNVPSAKDTEYYALQNGMIRNDDADILFLEEYWKVFSGTGRTAKSLLQQYYPYIHEQGGDSGYYGRCICSKYPISNYTLHTYSNDAQRYYDSCTVTIFGVEVTLVITHLSTQSGERTVQLAELMNYLQTLDSFICAGDFNTLDCRNTSGEDYTAIIVPLLNAGYNLANCSSFGFLTTYEDNGWVGCLDNIVTSSNIEIVSATVDTTKLTDGITDKVDHMPLITNVMLFE